MNDFIIEAEQHLLNAIKNCNVVALDDLLCDRLIFTDQNGQLLTKNMDLNVYKSGELSIDIIHISEQVIRQIGGVAVVSVMQNMKGKFRGKEFEGHYRYTRIWAKIDGTLQVIAGSCVEIKHSQEESK
ncbi:nuclear transport factor 2 family protein [Pedobacter aquatilis]|uniref:nuclear transport factor 2 family protein n=1 Tax=Pedobacter aquatilis TaxID=351343 RepID=UPI00292E95DE|nr:nuclear transport factor 2 family protein [Pedobacter aquatilis]